LTWGTGQERGYRREDETWKKSQLTHHQLGADLLPMCGEACRSAVCVWRPQISSVHLAGGVHHHSHSCSQLKHATGAGSRGGDRRTAGRAGSQAGGGSSGRVASLAAWLHGAHQRV